MSDNLEYDIVASIVLYKHKKEEILKIAKDFFASSRGLKRKLCLIDNSPEKSDYSDCESDILEYRFTNHNGGYGYGHNKAIHGNQGKTKYHVVLNPDIEIRDNVITNLYKEMEANKDIGLCAPRIKNSDGTTQYSARKLPKFSDILLRGAGVFIPSLRKKFMKNEEEQTLKSLNDNGKPFLSPFISGCFMFMRGTNLNKVKGFDEKFFMYYEDLDLSRRLAETSKNVVFPQYSITHAWERASTKNLKLLKTHVTSMVKYFSTYGFFRDKKRDKINNEINTFESKLKKKKNIKTINLINKTREKIADKNDKESYNNILSNKKKAKSITLFAPRRNVSNFR